MSRGLFPWGWTQKDCYYRIHWEKNMKNGDKIIS